MTDATKAPGYLFQITCDCGNGKNLHVSGNFPVGADSAHMNGEVDKINAVFDRQRAKHEVPLIEERIEGTKQQLESREADLELLIKQHPNLNDKSPIHSNINKAKAEIAALKVSVVRGEITLAETRQKAA